MNHFRPAEVAVSNPCGTNPAAATASSAAAPTGVDHQPATAMIVPITATAQTLMPIASASLSPASRSRDLRAQPKPGSTRQAAVSRPKRSMPIQPVAARRTTQIAMATASVNASFFVNYSPCQRPRTISLDADLNRARSQERRVRSPRPLTILSATASHCHDQITIRPRQVLPFRRFSQSGNDPTPLVDKLESAACLSYYFWIQPDRDFPES